MPKKKLPRDVNQLAKVLTERATDEKANSPKPEKNAAAVALGRLGGLKGGKARAEKLSKSRRSEIAAEAAAQRWARKKSLDRLP